MSYYLVTAPRHLPRFHSLRSGTCVKPGQENTHRTGEQLCGALQDTPDQHPVLKSLIYMVQQYQYMQTFYLIKAFPRKWNENWPKGDSLCAGHSRQVPDDVSIWMWFMDSSAIWILRWYGLMFRVIFILSGSWPASNWVIPRDFPSGWTNSWWCRLSSYWYCCCVLKLTPPKVSTTTENWYVRWVKSFDSVYCTPQNHYVDINFGKILFQICNT